ncbi:hypothetical protein SAMN05216420_103208 [Nitrosospira sp. Nl5]|uniref:DUF2325 domain-containing protein n=1 Tax=Nitrosospira sp. Nl5 TaxID=200120 RepID=UPI000884BC69|nr:DUF2325 domain-containing protein [Nitrosospira sp. Nl5]SCY21476.1 hypothetical protein SAMN05216420_103208 [Nitrosospira sp. Nl5]
MRQLKKAASGVTFPFPITDARRPDEILLAFLQGAEAMSIYLLHGRPRADVGASERHDSHHSFPGRIQALLDKKFGHVIRQFFKVDGGALFLTRAGLTRMARRREAEGRIAELKSADSQQVLLKRIDLLERKLADAETRLTHEADWAPLIKVSATPEASITAFASDGDAPDCNVRDEKQACANLDLAGRCILCVGGRAKLYPEYRRLVETSGGSLLIYRSGPRNDVDHLSTLFARADMVVCPADCVNHHTYFAVKRYCTRSGKACVLLDRSNLSTFRKGVEALAALVASPVVTA